MRGTGAQVNEGHRLMRVPMGFIGLIKIFDLILDHSYRVWLMTSTSTEAGHGTSWI